MLFFSNFTRQQVFTDTRSDQGLTQLIQAYFTKFGLSDPEVKDFNDLYKVTVSSPANGRPNTVALLTTDGSIMHTEPNLEALENMSPRGQHLPVEYSLPFVAYAPSGSAQVK